MKKGLVIAVVAVAVAGAGSAAAYQYYQQKEEAKAYDAEVQEAIAALPQITVYEQDDLPSVEEEFTGLENYVDIDSVQPDISAVTTTVPGEYEVIYTFTDTSGVERTATVGCTVKPDLPAHVSGMTDIEVNEGGEIPSVDTTFDEYVEAVTMNTDGVDVQEAGTYEITYTILGADGDQVVADGYKCTVNEAPPLTQHVAGLKDIEVEQGSEAPTEVSDDVSFDSYVESVTLNASGVDTETPGEYPITYSILGTDGRMESVEDYVCNVIETEAPETEESETETDGLTDAVGNVEVQETVVETGDETNFLIIVVVLLACVAAITGCIVYKKKAGRQG